MRAGWMTMCVLQWKHILEFKDCLSLLPKGQLSVSFPSARKREYKKAWHSYTGKPGLSLCWEDYEAVRYHQMKKREQRMSDRRKWRRENWEQGNAERKAIISQHPDAMTAVDRQGEMLLIAKLSSSLATNPSSPHSLSLPIISLLYTVRKLLNPLGYLWL